MSQVTIPFSQSQGEMSSPRYAPTDTFWPATPLPTGIDWNTVADNEHSPTTADHQILPFNFNHNVGMPEYHQQVKSSYNLHQGRSWDVGVEQAAVYRNGGTYNESEIGTDVSGSPGSLFSELSDQDLQAHLLANQSHTNSTWMNNGFSQGETTRMPPSSSSISPIIGFSVPHSYYGQEPISTYPTGITNYSPTTFGRNNTQIASFFRAEFRKFVATEYTT